MLVETDHDLSDLREDDSEALSGTNYLDQVVHKSFDINFRPVGKISRRIIFKS